MTFRQSPKLRQPRNGEGVDDGPESQHSTSLHSVAISVNTACSGLAATLRSMRRTPSPEDQGDRLKALRRRAGFKWESDLLWTTCRARRPRHAMRHRALARRGALEEWRAWAGHLAHHITIPPAGDSAQATSLEPRHPICLPANRMQQLQRRLSPCEHCRAT